MAKAREESDSQNDIATQIMRQMVRMPPKQHEDMKLGTRKKRRPKKKGDANDGKKSG